MILLAAKTLKCQTNQNKIKLKMMDICFKINAKQEKIFCLKKKLVDKCFR